MFRLPLGQSQRYCDGVSRRSFLQIGLAGMGSFGISDLLRARASAQESSGKKNSLILIWLDGGPSHMDTYDPKPDAPSEYRGIWRHIPTNVPGIDIGELFPQQAKLADQYSIIRSLHHNAGDHFTAGHWMLTGRGGVNGAMNAQKYPFIGSIATKVVGARSEGMPALVGVPYSMSIGLRPGYFGGNYLGVEHNPFETGGDPNHEKFSVQNLNLAGGLTIDRLADRRSLTTHFDEVRHLADQSQLMKTTDRFEQEAFDLVTGSQARDAFDIHAESPETRDRYGRTTWGQSVLLARRLVEAGTTIVTCHFGGWDTHWDHQQRMEDYLPRVDQIVSALLTDLKDRGLNEHVTVVVCGEFGRTPKMNDGGNGGAPMSKGTPGRDHWGNALSVLIAGGGIKGGTVVGATNQRGEHPTERPVRPGDLHHTLFHLLGVPRDLSFVNHAGRPVPAIDHGDLIQELLT